jgi:hypothetical protein
MNPFRRSVIRLVSLAALAVTTIALSGAASAESTRVTLSPGDGAPGAVGSAKVELDQTTLEGSIRAKNLPRQPFGSGHFYGVWLVRNDTGDKAFLGALINDKSIIFSAGGEGRMEFSATHFTDGPNAGSPITLGPTGSNLIIVLIENVINGLTPSPVGPVPGTGVAVAGTF